ncbi:NUDIX domain-containing protein [Paenibacillus dakarensis]|uniref:NUDIX domain-containing protein n=1 Tax=Paenibacillus dakarensis TaxID=1527293 RepID=UPI0012E2A452|nr:NUDIX domain-containing protein [Paenibacillus dakarensis]
MERQNQKYHVLARGIIISGENILVAHCKGMDNTFLPGGHVEFREGMRTTLYREIEEELGQDSFVKEYIGCVEADFEIPDTYHQEINHLFRVVLPKISHDLNPESRENHLEFYWIKINEMEQHNLQPYPVRDIIKRYLNNKEGPFWESTFKDYGD